VPEDPTAWIDYVNHRGERAVRRIRPLQLYRGESPFHAGTQWLLEAWDLDRQATRTFAMTGILGWFPEDPLAGREEVPGA
jgi:predicted DNA-binding transcriptional regulator YafY